METDDVLADQVQIRRPVLLKHRIAVAIRVITETGDIVRQGIQPYVNHVLRVKINGNAPAERRPRYAQILQTRQKEVVHHLIFAGLRLDKVRMRIDVIDQLRRILAHAEEIRRLMRLCHRPSAVRTPPVLQLTLCPEGLAGRAVPALVGAEVDIALVIHFFEDLLYLLLMVRIRGADELVIGSVHQIPDAVDLARDLIHILLRRDALFLGFLLDLLAVLVGSRLETDVESLHSAETGDRIREYDLIGVADVRLSRRIGDRRRYIIMFSCVLLHVPSSLLYIRLSRRSPHTTAFYNKSKECRSSALPSVLIRKIHGCGRSHRLRSAWLCPQNPLHRSFR